MRSDNGKAMAALENTVDCACCREDLQNVWVGNWNCPGCRARLLATLPTREQRMAWIRKWRDDGEHLMVNAVVDRLREIEACAG